MKIFLMTDMEGVSGGAIFSAYGLPPNPAVPQLLRLMMKEINAAIEGCFDAGAEEVIVHEAHTFDMEAIDPRAKISRGGRLIDELDESFDAMMFVGQHAMSLCPDGVLSHTGSSRSIRRVWINGKEAGEIALFAGVAGHYGVPVAFLSGDQAACREARALLGAVETAEVMQGVTNHSGLCLSGPSACKLIRHGAAQGLLNREKVKPLRFPTPVEIKVEFKAPALADSFCLIPGIKREDATTASYTGSDFIEAFKVGYLCLGFILNRWDRNPGH